MSEFAFPHKSSFSDFKGMTLRDYFAAHILQGMFAALPSQQPFHTANFVTAYECADAMLAARNKPKSAESIDIERHL